MPRHPVLAGVEPHPEIVRITSDPDFATFDHATQDRILTQLLGPGVGWWWSRRVARLDREAAAPLNATDIAAGLLYGRGR